MSLRLYVVMPERPISGDLRGMSGAALSRLVGRELQLVYEAGVEPLQTSTESVLAYGRIVQRLCALRDALPFRYGTMVADEGALAELLERRGAGWTQRLATLHGLAEFIVHVPKPAARPSTPAPMSGTRYLAERAREIQHTRALSDGLSSELGHCCSELRALGAQPDAVRLACLASPEALPAIAARIDEWGNAHAEARPRITGPWPPFSFAEEAA